MEYNIKIRLNFINPLRKISVQPLRFNLINFMKIYKEIEFTEYIKLYHNRRR
jgi:hypothetical protein